MNEEEKTLNLDDVKFLLEKVYAAQQAGNHVIFRHSNYSTEVIAMQGEISEEKEWDKKFYMYNDAPEEQKATYNECFCILKNWQVRNMTINFVLHKYNQTEAALESQSASQRLLEQKSCTGWDVAKSLKRNGVPTK